MTTYECKSANVKNFDSLHTLQPQNSPMKLNALRLERNNLGIAITNFDINTLA